MARNIQRTVSSNVAIAYLRASTDDQKLSPEAQRAAIEAHLRVKKSKSGHGSALGIADERLRFAASDAQIGMPEIIRGSYGRSATPTLYHSGIPTKLAFYIQVSGRNLSGTEAARIGLVTGAMPKEDLQAYVAQLAAEVASRNPVALEHAKIAAYTEMDLPFEAALKVDEALAHRMRMYTNPLGDVEGYLASQKGGGNLGYKKPK